MGEIFCCYCCGLGGVNLILLVYFLTPRLTSKGTEVHLPLSPPVLGFKGVCHNAWLWFCFVVFRNRVLLYSSLGYIVRPCLKRYRKKKKKAKWKLIEYFSVRPGTVKLHFLAFGFSMEWIHRAGKPVPRVQIHPLPSFQGIPTPS